MAAFAKLVGQMQQRAVNLPQNSASNRGANAAVARLRQNARNYVPEVSRSKSGVACVSRYRFVSWIIADTRSCRVYIYIHTSRPNTEHRSPHLLNAPVSCATFYRASPWKIKSPLDSLVPRAKHARFELTSPLPPFFSLPDKSAGGKEGRGQGGGHRIGEIDVSNFFWLRCK